MDDKGRNKAYLADAGWKAGILADKKRHCHTLGKIKSYQFIQWKQRAALPVDEGSFNNNKLFKGSTTWRSKSKKVKKKKIPNEDQQTSAGLLKKKLVYKSNKFTS